MKKRMMSIALSAALLLGSIAPVSPVYALPEAENGMVTSKTIEEKSNGGYTITLESYSTGAGTIVEQKEAIPADIVLVLDQSGSMGTGTIKVSNTEMNEFYGNQTRNSNLYNYRFSKENNNANKNNLYYFDGTGYRPVVVDVQELYEPYPGSHSQSEYRQYDLYLDVNGKKEKITQTRNYFLWVIPTGTTYKCNGKSTTITNFSSADLNERFGSTVYRKLTKYTYKYLNPDDSNDYITIGTSIGDDTYFETPLYYKQDTSKEVSNLQALKDAVTLFAESIEEEAKGEDGFIYDSNDEEMKNDDVNHRVAIVGFANDNRAGANGSYNNTELFIGSKEYKYGTTGTNGISNQYKNAFQDMSTSKGVENIAASVDKLEANGATYTNFGMAMAQKIFEEDPKKAETPRNKVVVVFTDGTPGYSGYDSTVANSAIKTANALKENGVTVYVVAILDDADPTKVGNANTANWFMQNLSSNNGIVQNPSYYLVAKDSTSLNRIFEQISKEIQSGGASNSSVSASAVVKDVVTPQFNIPENANVTIQTSNYIGEDTWSTPVEDLSIRYTIERVSGNRNASLSVTNFDYNENWVGKMGSTYRGKKLIVKFDIDVREGFLGGNDVPTNTGAFIYQNQIDAAANMNPVVTFKDRPTVNVPIKDFTVEDEIQNIYLGTQIDPSELGNSVNAKIDADDNNRQITIDFSQSNYGLASWQTAYVDIKKTVVDEDSQSFGTDAFTATDDVEYAINVNIKPVTDGSTTTIGQANNTAGLTRSGDGKLNVFKPTMTFEDGHVYLGGAFADAYGNSKNFVKTVWKHDDVAAGDTVKDADNNDVVVTVLGDAPELNVTYETKTGVISTDTDIDVNVEKVEIGTTDVTSHVTFAHQACEQDPKLDPECVQIDEHPAVDVGETRVPEFKLHVYTPTITFKDVTAYYGDTAPALNDDTFLDSEISWAHGNYVPASMDNAKPDLDITYTAEDGKLVTANNVTTVETLEDIAINAEVKVDNTDLTPYVTFDHTECKNSEAPDKHQGNTENTNEAWIHVKSCELTVAKEAAKLFDEKDTFIFKVIGPDYDQEVVLKRGESKKLTGLKVGSYTVTEDSNWSWRYTNNGPKTVELGDPAKGKKDKGNATIKNTLSKNPWLTAIDAITNMFKK